MKPFRYLLRVSPPHAQSPIHRPSLLTQARACLPSPWGDVTNLRVTPVALEFDLFADSLIKEDDVALAVQSLGRLVTFRKLGIPPIDLSAERIVSEAQGYFYEYRFWEVHEVLEDLWKVRQGTEKELIQGIILIAAALVHVQRNEPAPVRAMLADACSRLQGKPSPYFAWDVQSLCQHFQSIMSANEMDLRSIGESLPPRRP